jgi:Fe-Mn family superoxide dismutase
MTDLEVGRREVLAGGALIAVAAAGAARAQDAGAAVAPAATFEPKLLSFDPATVPGLSERLLRSHYDNNYSGAVRRLGQIEAQFAALDVANAPGFQLNGLKREELVAWNSMILHEVYFAGFGERAQPDAALGAAIERDFGSMDRWAQEFSAMGRALGGGSGWVLLTWSPRDNRLVNTWAADHTMILASGTPLLALDMYEHAYHMDFGASTGGYVDAFMQAFSWRNANELFQNLV